MIDEFAHITPAMWLEKEAELLRSVHSLWDGVPLLNITDSRNLPNNRLVKFRGMIQDILNPEYYYEECKVYNTITKETVTKTMKFCDLLPYERHEILYSNNPSNVVKERLTFIVTTIPGLNKWVRSVEQDIALPVNSIVESSKTQKRPIEDAEMDVGESSSGSPERKKARTTEPQNPKLSSCPKQPLIIQNPQPNCCHVSVYKDADTLKMLDLVEFVGFLSVSNTAEPSHGSDEPMDVQTDSPSPSLIIRIHCVTFKKIEHCNLLVYGSKLPADRFAYIKNTLHFALTQLMMGDTLAAEYLIYHFISKVYSRNEALGQFSLNISHIPLSVPEFAKCVYEFVELLVPTSQYVAMTVENMNSLPFIPRKDYDTDRLVTGLLQVSNNTHLLLDETKLEPGQFNESGTEAMTALRIAIDFQKVAYNYYYYSVNFDCDIAFLILSEGKSLLPVCIFQTVK
ncbi:hypothetical protein RI129_012098 [Pyrocoelia pectoralis]|uniref:Mini-chromosome maintenance complex-binding protein n=1 Tax=Pyrocoelia pectoralis TaxID=417401 RepID=A0AAN7ZGH4_9COLE